MTPTTVPHRLHGRHWLVPLIAALYLLICITASSTAAAAAPDRWEKLATPLFEHIGLDQGLPHPVAMALAQDGDGFIWIGTQRGLGRWDGYRMLAFVHNASDPYSIPADFIQALHVDRRGRLWIGTATGGLAMYDKVNERFIRFPAGANGLADAAINAIASDGMGGVWVGTPSGLDYVDPARIAVRHYRHEPGVPGSLPDSRIRALHLDRKGNLWIGTSSGLARRDAVSGQFTAVPVGPDGADAPWRDAVLSFGENSRGQIAFGTLKSGVGVVDAGAARGRMMELAGVSDSHANMVLAITEIVPGRWWASTYGGGIIDIEADSARARRILHQAAVPSSLANDRTAALLRDRSGLIWISNERSVDFHDPNNRAVAAVFGAHGMPEAAVTALMTDSGGRVWLGLADQGVDLIDPDGTRSAALRPDPARLDSALPNRVLLAMAEATPQDAWIGTQLGLYRTLDQGRRVERIALPQANPYPRIGTIAPQAGQLWLGTFEGLLRYDPAANTLTSYVTGPGGLSDNRIQALMTDPGGALWIGTRNGLNRLDPTTGKIEQILANPSNESALSDPVISALAMDGRGRLWVATHGGGINVLEMRTPLGAPVFRRLGLTDGLPSTAVSALRLDRSARMWAATGNGIAVIDSGSLKARPLARAEGLGFPTYFIGAAAATPEDDLLFGATGGLTVIHPERLANWEFRPPLAISSLRTDGHPVAGAQVLAQRDSRLILPPGIKGFEIEVAALDFSDAKRNRYAFLLEGYDQSWVENDANRRVAAYSNLAPGSYRLRVRGANRDGVWADEELSIRVRVLPAWHQTWWAYLSYVLAGAAAAYGLYRWRVGQLQRSRAALQALVYSRTQHLEKLNAIVKSINEQLDFDALLHTILRESMFIKGIDAAWALVREADTDTLAVRAVWDRAGGTPVEERMDLLEAEARYVNAGEMITTDIYLTRAGVIPGQAGHAQLAVRICIEHRIEGFLVFENRAPQVPLEDGDLELLKALKEPFVSAFQKANALRLIEQARARAEAATRAKSEFLANISHEIRTPMNAILGFAGLGTHLELDAKPRDYFRKIARAGNNLLDIINDILDFSKIEAGKLELEVVPFDLPDTLTNIVDLFAWRAAEKELELVIWAAPDVPQILMGDPLRLGQVLINLVGNALKFTAHGHIQLRVERAKDWSGDDNQVRLCFSVEDSGVGISPEQQERLFQAFAQADASTTRIYGGTGLGLAISQQLVRKMGSEIGVDSELGAGSRFHFTLTLNVAPAQGPARLQAGAGARGKKVLVVDDSAPTREMLELQLRSFGFDASAVGSGAAALFALQLEPYDLVLMDWNMPDMDGLETARRIKDDPTLASIPSIIMVTAFARDHIKAAAEEAGIGAFLVKPVTASQLLDSVLATMGFDAAVPGRDAAPFPSQAAEHIRGARVLVVDDNLVNQQVASEILRRAGVHVDLAGNGVDAVRLVDQTDYDAVLMDIQMPEMDGYQASARIRANPRHAELPIIAMTAHAVAGYRDSCLAMGMNDYLSKPIEPAILYAVLAGWIHADPTRVPAESTPQPEVGGVPDHLPGIDVEAALARLGHNGPLLTRLLTMFAKDFAGTHEAIAQAVDGGDLDNAALLVHKVKGAAGNLSAQQLYSAAGELEERLMAKDGKTAMEILPGFLRLFDEVMDGANSREKNT
ncbi:hybrid sensor histidine kinase/response regulator [Massilia scottii]|uniref:hybrid sensor histidine kinase/response regulator n=1 Tax=Massilia scottii TaxID=3057166 RepID=UPI0027968D2C|nr:response regulator [Massilia sp. CCM 9029]MDQ1833771.1 response regulator [Massilia sp. CCM 9029]